MVQSEFINKVFENYFITLENFFALKKECKML